MKVSRRSTLAGIAGSLVPGASLARATHQRVGTAAGASGPIPVSIAPTSFTTYDNATIGQTVVTLTATMSDSSMFTGTWGFTTPYNDASGLVAFSGSSLVLTRGLSGADDGTHMITVTATENGHTIPQDLTMTVTPPPAATNYVTGVVAGSPNTTTWSAGIQIVVGGSPLTVYTIGRWRLSGNSHVHDLWIFDGSENLVPGGHVTIDMSSGTLNAFKYATFPSPVILQAGGTYYIQSQENGASPTAAPDTSLSNDTTITTTGVASATAAGVSWTSPNYTSGFFISGANAAFGPVDFTYTVGFPAGYEVQQAGGPGAAVGIGDAASVQGLFFGIDNQTGLLYDGSAAVVTGTVIAHGSTINGVPSGMTSWTAQWMIDDNQPLSLPITSSVASPPYFPFTFDSTLVTDGTHIIYARIIDGVGADAFGVRCTPSCVIVSNGTLNTGTQTFYAAGTGLRLCNPIPDRVTFTAGNPNPDNTTYPFPYTFSAPASARGWSPMQIAALRDQTNIVYEAWNSPKEADEYIGNAQFCTTPVGGVFVQYLDPLLDHPTIETATDPSWSFNSPDGTRLNAQVSSISTFVEAPSWFTGSFAWLGVSAEGRLFVMDHAGTVTTICGVVRDKTKLTIDPADPALNVDADMPNYQNFIGTATDGSDLYGAVDLCVDTRNDHVIYVCCQLTNCIVKVTLTGTSIAGGITASFAVWAGARVDAIAGSLVDSTTGALNARFFQPGSIIMSDGTGNSGAIGTMYVADTQNNAIRKIDPTGVNVTTLYGGNGSIGPGPTPVDISVATNFTTVNLSSPTSANMTWSTAGGGTLSITTASPTLVQGVGFFIAITGSVNGGSAGSVNVSSIPTGEPFWTVNGFTDSSHFTVAMPGTTGQYGPFSGTVQILSYQADFYSRPGTVSLLGSTGWVIQPAVLRFCSSGNIVLCEFYSAAARELDLVANTARRIGLFDGKISAQVIESSPPALTPQGGGWQWMDCDSKGVLGPVDDIVLASFQSANSAAHYDWRLGFTDGFNSPSPNDGGFLFSVGQNDSIREGAGHYPWAWSFARTEGRAIGGGNATYPPSQLRIQETTDYVVTQPNGPNINIPRLSIGAEIFQGGTALMFPRASRPGFQTFWSFNGNGHVWGHSFDDLMNNTGLGSFASTTPGDAGDQALAAYIVAGMGGSVPRPELAGAGSALSNDMMDMILWIRRNTMQGSGYSPANAGNSYHAQPPVQPQPYNFDAPPIISNISASRAGSDANGDKLTVTWTTSKLTIGCASAGSTAQNSVSGSYPTIWKTNVFSPIESGYGTSHSVTITGILHGISPIYYNVVSKDQAGNCQFSATLTIT